MVVDASALLAILFTEPERRAFSLALNHASSALLSPVNWYEAVVNAESHGTPEVKALESLIQRIGIQIIPVDEVQMKLAHAAWRKYGKGRHKARLNMGDCFAYALAKHTGESLLYKGKDFVHTDIRSALP
ncbi:MAG: type II toxin-antitoxin system VapC family toxin [Alphaproteobacteria bacterium]|jgi:ribonuclease VapC|nr:type II toxin-antitoxin system VapC family toxin [Alphaproteobacteria bacterium]